MINIFANRLRAEREFLGLKQKEMADKLNIPHNTYNGYETGKRSPSLGVAKEIADFLNVSLDYLLGESNTKHNTPDENKEIEEIAKLILQLDEKDKKKIMNYIDIALSEVKSNKKE